jgi:hypothetical protein
MERDQATKFINDLLRLMISRNGSDLFLTAEFPPAIKVDGKVTKVSPQPLPGQHTVALARLHGAQLGGGGVGVAAGNVEFGLRDGALRGQRLEACEFLVGLRQFGFSPLHESALLTLGERDEGLAGFHALAVFEIDGGDAVRGSEGKVGALVGFQRADGLAAVGEGLVAGGLGENAGGGRAAAAASGPAGGRCGAVVGAPGQDGEGDQHCGACQKGGSAGPGSGGRRVHGFSS